MSSDVSEMREARLVHERSPVHELPRYEQETAPCDIELGDNTNAFGTPPGAARAIRETPAEAVFRYPSSYSRGLLEEIAKYVGVSADEICVGCGSGDVLDCAYRAFAAPGQSVAIIHPTFIMARIYGLTNRLSVAPVPVQPDFDADVYAMLAHRPAVTYLCSPNNPTGSLLTPTAIRTTLQGAPGLVILDEAYAEFSGVSLAAEAPIHGRLLVLRTFSKAFGLAGLRVGYGIASSPVIEELEKVRGPYRVSSVGERAALAALKEDRAWIQEAVNRITANRDRFADALRGQGFAPLKSSANFLLVPVHDAREAAAALRAQRISVRPYPDLPHVGDALRIGIGPWEVMDLVLAAMSSSV